MTPPRAALILKVDTLGDLVLFAPALQALRTAWPDTRLAVVIRRAYLDLAGLLVPAAPGGPGVEWLPTRLDPFTHRPDADPAELARLRDAVAGLQPEVVAAATSRRNWLEIVLAAGAPAARRVALGAETVDAFFDTHLRVQLGIVSTGIFEEAVEAPDDEADWRRGFRLAGALVGTPLAPVPPALAPATAAADPVLAEHGLARGRYAVCAAAGFANVRLKTWPADRFTAVIAHLRARHGVPTLLVGQESEREHLAGIAGAAGIWLGREGELPVLAALLAGAALYVGNDTGAMHLAAAVGAPVLGVFGGGTWPRFVPAATRGAALVHPLPCFGCGWDCAFGDAPCLGGVSVADATAAVDAMLAAPAAPFAVRECALPAAVPAAEHLALIAASAARYRESRADHLARQHKLEELTELAREKDAAIQEKHQAVVELRAACDERLQTILVLDGHVKHFQAENNALKADKAVLDQTFAALPEDAARSAKAISDQLVHIRNLEALLKLRDEELAELKRTQSNRAAGLHDLENAKHYGRLLAEKEAVIQALSEGLQQREAVIQQLLAETTSTMAGLRKLRIAAGAWWHERFRRPLEARIFRAVVENYWMQIGVLRHYPPRPLAWDRRLPGPARPDTALPQIAVVTPSYGQERFLERTLRSVLDQRYPQLLYVVQDGASRDGSPALIARHASRLRHWESVPDRGQADAIRRGFAHVAADLRPDDVMAWLNSDDLLAPGALRCVAEYFAAHPEADLVYGHRLIIDEEDREVGRWIMPPHDPATLEWIDYVPQETMFWRKRAWDRVGGIDPTFQFALDWDLLARFQQAGCRLVRLPYFLGAFRVHAEQKTSQVIHTVGADEMRRVRARFHGPRADDSATIERHARRTRFRGALHARLLALGLRW